MIYTGMIHWLVSRSWRWMNVPYLFNPSIHSFTLVNNVPQGNDFHNISAWWVICPAWHDRDMKKKNMEHEHATLYSMLQCVEIEQWNLVHVIDLNFNAASILLPLWYHHLVSIRTMSCQFSEISIFFHCGLPAKTGSWYYSSHSIDSSSFCRIAKSSQTNPNQIKPKPQYE